MDGDLGSYCDCLSCAVDCYSAVSDSLAVESAGSGFDYLNSIGR